MCFRVHLGPHLESLNTSYGMPLLSLAPEALRQAEDFSTHTSASDLQRFLVQKTPLTHDLLRPGELIPLILLQASLNLREQTSGSTRNAGESGIRHSDQTRVVVPSRSHGDGCGVAACTHSSGDGDCNPEVHHQIRTSGCMFSSAGWIARGRTLVRKGK